MTRLTPVLEYASPVWAGRPHYLQQEIERVDRQDVRRLRIEFLIWTETA
jgi:hypothetical protein